MEFFIKLDSCKENLILISSVLDSIIQNYVVFVELYKICKNDIFFSNVESPKFIASFSELTPNVINLSFTSTVNSSEFIPNPFLSEFFGLVTFIISSNDINAKVFIQFYDQFSNPERVFKIYEKYNYLIGDSTYTRKLDNTQAGRLEISGDLNLDCSRCLNVKEMVSFLKGGFNGMNEFLCNINWIGNE